MSSVIIGQYACARVCMFVCVVAQQGNVREEDEGEEEGRVEGRRPGRH